jgi:ribosomal protein S18 acetylase RimI-like enzyme
MEPSESLRLVVKPPRRCNAKELAAFSQLVRKGGEVNVLFLKEGLRRAYSLGFCYAGARLVGVAALKHSDLGHQNDVFQRAGVPNLAAQYQQEIGYVCVDEDFRRQGICSRLVQELLGKADDVVFASARVRNMKMISILRGFGFRPLGHRFIGRHKRDGRYYVQLFVLEKEKKERKDLS